MNNHMKELCGMQDKSGTMDYTVKPTRIDKII